MLTEVMAYLAQLKTTSRNNYEAVKRLISSDGRLEGTGQKAEKMEKKEGKGNGEA